MQADPGLVDERTMNIPLENASSTEKNTSHSGVVIAPLNMAISCFVLGSFLAGTTLNGLFLWVSGVKMKRTVNTLWFFHLILTYLDSSPSMPFVAVYALLDYRWVFGPFLCKLINTFDSLRLIKLGHMDQGNMTHILRNTSTDNNTSLHIASAVLIMGSFLVGTPLYGLILWVLGVKMKTTVNVLWFRHLILSYVPIFFYLFFRSIHILLTSNWVFGLVLCKLVNFLASLGIFSTVFLLTIISLDRYLLICHPVWSQHNRTIPRAKRLILAVWLISTVLSAPYLAFRETREVDGHIKCVNNYALSRDWDGARTQALRYQIHLTFFVFRFLLVFLIPFSIIMGCYCQMAQEMKKKRLGKTRKSYSVMLAAVTSFFMFWLPYHFYSGSLLIKKMPPIIGQTLLVVAVIGACFNIGVTPILYVFVGEKFQQVFKTSIIAHIKRSFMDELITPDDSSHAGGYSTPHQQPQRSGVNDERSDL